MKKENKKAYLLAAGMGMGTSILMMIIHYIDDTSIGFGLNTYTFFLLFDNLLPISILIFLFIISKKIPAVWENTRIKIICTVILLLVYVIGFYFPVCLSQLDDPSCFLWLPIAPFITFLLGVIWIFEYPTQNPLLSTSLYSGIFIISAAYLAIKGIKNLVKRIILFFLIGFLICVTTATPLIFMHASY